MTEELRPEKGDQVRLLTNIGPHLPAGTIGILVEDTSAEYPNSADEQYVYSVLFKSLGTPTGQTYKDAKFDPKNLPHYNVVAMRRKDVERVKQSHTE